MSSSMIQIRGVEEVQRLLKEVGKKVDRDARNKILRDALKPARDLAKSYATRDSGELARKIDVRKVAKSNLPHYRVVSRAPHSYVVEFGHNLVKGGKLGEGGTIVGFVQGYPFMTPAADAQHQQIINDVAKGIKEAAESVK